MSYCQFCGQSYLELGSAVGEEQQNYSATMACTCNKGWNYRTEEKKKQDRKSKIDYIDKIVESYKKYFEDVENILTKEAVEFVKEAAVLVLDEKVKKAFIFISEIKISISKNSKGKIKFNLAHITSKLAEV